MIAHLIGLARALLLVIVLGLLPGGGVALAQNYSAMSLDELFESLAVAADPAAAGKISDEIWKRWTTPEDPALAADMQDVITAIREYAFGRALSLLDEMIAAHPGYAEAWNQRATINYMLENYEASLADIEEVLEREPRHFGALAGRALVYLRLGDEARALQSVIEALKYHPFLAERALFPQLMQPSTKI